MAPVLTLIIGRVKLVFRGKLRVLRDRFILLEIFLVFRDVHFIP